MVENQWTLWKYQPIKNYPSIWYFWIDPNKEIQFCRSVEPIGFLPVKLDADLWIGKKINSQQINKFCKKVHTKMTQEELSMGWLCK